jgi:hypothetical protein
MELAAIAAPLLIAAAPLGDDMNPAQEHDPQELAANRPAEADVPPWQELEPGRFMPRRVRGSCRGLALG